MDIAHITRATAAGYELSGGRIGASTTALIALAGVVLGVVALARSRGGRPTPALRIGRLASAAGAVGVVGGSVVVVTADGGVGTGGGVAGAVLGMTLGVVALVLGGIAIRRAGAAQDPAGSRP